MNRAVAIAALLAGAVFALSAAGQDESVLPAVPGALLQAQSEPIRLATTTSTENSGLLDAILPVFSERYGMLVDVVAVGTGAALELGRNGDSDVVMVHARRLEDAFVAEGYGINRRDFMYNDFVILGPPDDPAEVSSAVDAAEMMTRIAATGEPFISRGDDSGTHTRELALWREAGVEPDGPWYQEVGQGMGAVLSIANEQLAYTIADRGTFLSFRSDLDLAVLGEGDPALFNPYGIIAVDPARWIEVTAVGAMALITFVTSPEGQALIGDHRVDGEVLFTPGTREP